MEERMNESLFVKPATPALKVRNPAGGYLPTDGAAVPSSAYWRRRLADGDVVATARACTGKPAGTAKKVNSKKKDK
jgi:hypothetical protein